MKTTVLNKDTAAEILDAVTALDDQMFSGNKWGRDGFAAAAANEYDFLNASLDEEGVVTGYGLLRTFDDAEVIRIAVDPQKRRCGIGRILLKELMDEAARCGAGSILLEVRSGNASAIELYKSAGFTAEGIRKGYYHEPTEDALIMRYTC